jgi:predicted aspartyl protease
LPPKPNGVPLPRIVSLFVFTSLLFAAAAHAAPQPYGSQPLIRLANGRPGVMVAINGYGPFPFLVDTATSHSVLTPALRDRLKIPATGGPSFAVVTAAGSLRSHFHLIGEIATSGVIVERVNAIVIDLPPSLGAMGIVGADFLSNFTVDLDLQRRIMTLYPERSVVEPPGFQRINGVVNSAGFIVARGRADNAAASFVYDSGAVLTVANETLARQTARQPKIVLRNIESKVIDAAMQRGSAESVSFRRLSVGPATWLDARVLIARMHVFEQVGLADTPTLFIGDDLMAGRRIILDYGNAALYLAP